MDLNSLLSELVDSNVVENLGQATGASVDEVKKVLGSALPSLITGATQQAANAETLEGFTNALQQHSADDTSDLGAFFSGYDRADGGKIVNHLLGTEAENVTGEVTRSTGVSGLKVAAIMAIAAPLLMKLLGKGAANAAQAAQTAQATQQAAAAPLSLSTDNVSNMMGGLLGGGADMSSMLGSLLGGGSSNQSSGGLLGGLLNFFKG